MINVFGRFFHFQTYKKVDSYEGGTVQDNTLTFRWLNEKRTGTLRKNFEKKISFLTNRHTL